MEIVTILLLLFLAIGGAVGGLSFVVRPDGSGLGMSVDLLDRSPINNYRMVGIFLLAVMSFWPLLSIVWIITRAPWAALSVGLLGAVCIAWIIYQYSVIRTYSVFQPLIITIGILLIVCAFGLA